MNEKDLINEMKKLIEHMEVANKAQEATKFLSKENLTQKQEEAIIDILNFQSQLMDQNMELTLNKMKGEQNENN